MKISLLADCPAEAPKIAKWYYDEWGRLDAKVTQEMVLEKVIQKSVNRDKIPMAIVAHIEADLVGVLELKLRENKHYPEYENWIGGVFIRPSNRRQGIASVLLESAKEIAVKAGVKTLYLQCDSNNIPLYSKHGFKALDQAQHHEIETTIMAWDVAI